MNDKSYRPDIRKAAIERVCLPMLQNATIKITKDFYINHIKEIMDIIEAKLVKVGHMFITNQFGLLLSSFAYKRIRVPSFRQ